jgi:tetratricopeptide (TPR) repeat protein
MGVRKPVEQTTEDALLHFLGDRSALLAFDGIELHREALASLLRTLLKGCANVAVLTASLFPVATGIDVRYRLGGLATPTEATEESDAVAVFVDRAQEVEPNFRLNDRTLRAVADLVERLDGNPRAIQIAARKANLLSPQQMINRLDRPLDFFQSTLPGRNASMRQSLAWGFGLLSDRAQSLLGSLGVFRGSFTVDDAEALGDDLDALGELVDGGFLVPVHGRFAQRFVIAPFYRWFLREKEPLIPGAVEEAWARRIEEAVRLAPNLETEAAKEVIRALQDDIAAFVRSRASRREDAPRALACVVNAANYWLIGDGAELGYELATLVVMAPGSAQSPEFPRGLIAASAFAYQTGHPAEARLYARQALRETSDPKMRAKAWVNYGTAVSAVGRNRSALRAMEYAARNATLAKDDRLVWHARTNIMALAARIYRDDLALVAARELEALGSQDFILRPYFEMNYADLLIRTGHYGDAERRLRTALDWFQSLENAVECARCLRTIGQLRLAEGDIEAACIAYTEAMNHQAQGAISETEQVKMTADLHRIREQLGESRYLELRLQANAFDYNSLR